jgi:hypothetical protein
VNPVRPLYLTAVVLAVSGLALRLVPLGPLGIAGPAARAVHYGDQSLPIPVRPATGEIDTVAADPIVTANIFARSRVAPTRAARVVAPADRAPKMATPRTAPFTLYGTTIGPQGAVALIDDNTPPRGAHVHYMGDVIDGARLVAITDSTVTLDRPSGPLVLHLPPTLRQSP